MVLEQALEQARLRAAAARNPTQMGRNLYEKLVAKSNLTLTEDQHEALRGFADFAADPDPNRKVFILKGYAGTGKTTLVSLITRTLRGFGLNTFLMAPTGRAAKVMSLYSQKSAFTIHRTIFRPAGEEGGLKVGWRPQKNYNKNTLFIVDEASMLACTGDDNLMGPLLEYVFQHEDNKLLLVGDDAQLPPVSQPESLALDPRWVGERYYIHTEAATLTQVIRQQAESGILANATALRNNISRNVLEVAFSTKEYPDIFRMGGERLGEGIEYAYRKYGMESSLLVCRSNKTATKYNQYIRRHILHLENEVDSGELVMVVRNNYKYPGEGGPVQFLANGDFARIRRVRRIEEMHGLRFADVELELPDYPDLPGFDAKVMLDTLYTDQANLGREQNQVLYQAVLADYADIKSKAERNQAMRDDPYLNALQIKFAYALTCHKSQGGQWDAVFVEQGYLPDDAITLDFQRWLYTACTRAKQELYLVNFKPEFFDAAKYAEAVV